MSKLIQLKIKRSLDLIGALILLIIASPLFIILPLILLVTQGLPIVFSQERPGLKGKIFRVYKFRTMSIGNESDEARLTPIGKFFRKLSLDELPQLINILKGELSFVGPRPLLVEYLPLYSSEQMRRHDMLPGITGMAQVNGRNATSWDERFKHDLYYVDNWSLLLDLQIIFKTITVVFSRKGVSNQEHVTMPKFTGEKQ